MAGEAPDGVMGGDGHDAGPKGLAVLALALLLPAPMIGAVSGIVGAGTWWGQGIYVVGKAWLLLFPVAWWFVVMRRGWPAGFRLSTRGMGMALATGAAIFAVIVGAYLLAGRAMIDPSDAREIAAGNQLDVLWRFLALATFITFVNAWLEEYVWRWFVFERFADLTGPTPAGRWAAVLLAAAAFTAHHTALLWLQFGPVIAAIGSAGVFVGGATWSWLYMRYGTVWPAYVSHILADVAVFVVGYWVIFG